MPRPLLDRAVFLALAVTLLFACRRPQPPSASVPGPTPLAAFTPAPEPRVVVSETATATWYNVPPRSLPARRAPGLWTAAHDRFPFGTRVRVTRLGGERSVIVHITDRGVGRGKIDLCKPAAAEIGLVGEGRARVRVERLAE